MTTSVQELLSRRVRGTIRTISEARGLLRHFNHPEWPDQIKLVLGAADGLVEVHGVEPDTAIANDYAGLRAIICQIDWPESDLDGQDDEDGDQRLTDLRARVAMLGLDCDYIIGKAASIGITPDRVDLPLPDSALVSKAGRENLLAGLIDRLHAVETQLATLLDPTSPEEPSRYQRMVRFYLGTMRANAGSIRAAIGVGTMIDLGVLERAASAMATVTRQFIGTLAARASEASDRLKAAARQIGVPVRRITRGIATIVRHVARSEAREPPEAVLPEDYVDQATNMILAGHAPPAAWTPHLTQLSFYKSSLTDLLPLAGLTALKSLYLHRSHVSDLSPLEGLSALTSLSFSGTQVSDLSPLAGLTALSSLDCHETQVSDLSPLAGLNALSSLDCHGTQVSDLSPLAGLNALSLLYCHETQVSDLSPLAGLNALTSLYCHDTQVNDLSPLTGLTALRSLSVSGTLVSDLSPLKEFSNLTTLSFSSTQVNDLSPLAGLRELKSIYCSQLEVVDLSPLAGLKLLSKLNCWSTEVSDLSPLKDLKELRELDCSDTKVIDLSPLENLTALTLLDCAFTKVSDLAPIEGLTALTKLDFADTKVTDLSPLAGLTALTQLDCSYTKVNDLSPLLGLNALRRLDLVRTPVIDLSFIGQHTDLTVNVESEERAAVLRGTRSRGSTVVVQKASWLGPTEQDKPSGTS